MSNKSKNDDWSIDSIEKKAPNKKVLNVMYYFLLVAALLIPITMLFQLVYIDLFREKGIVESHTQYYIWNSWKLLTRILKDTADGRSFVIMGAIPLVIYLVGIVLSFSSFITGLRMKFEWKHGEACRRALSTIIAGILSTILIIKIIDPFFNLQTGYADQQLHFNLSVFVSLGLAIIARLVAEQYYKLVKRI